MEINSIFCLDLFTVRSWPGQSWALSSTTKNSGNFQGSGLGVMISCFLETGASTPGVSSTAYLLSEVFFHGTALTVPTD